MMKKMAVDSKTKGKKPVYPHTTYVVNCCQRKVAGVVFWLNWSIYHSLTLDVVQVLIVRTSLNLAKDNTVPCMCTVTLSLGQRVDDWLHSLTCRKDNYYI